LFLVNPSSANDDVAMQFVGFGDGNPYSDKVASFIVRWVRGVLDGTPPLADTPTCCLCRKDSQEVGGFLCDMCDTPLCFNCCVSSALSTISHFKSGDYVPVPCTACEEGVFTTLPFEIVMSSDPARALLCDDFRRQNADVIPGSCEIDEEVLSQLMDIKNAKHFFRSEVLLQSAKQSFTKTLKNARDDLAQAQKQCAGADQDTKQQLTVLVNRSFCTQGLVKPLVKAAKGSTMLALGHPFDAIPSQFVSFKVFGDDKVQFDHKLHDMLNSSAPSKLIGSENCPALCDGDGEDSPPKQLEDMCNKTMMRWISAKANPCSPAMREFFELQDEIHKKLLAVCMIGQVRGDAGVESRILYAEKTLQQAAARKDLLAIAQEWFNPYADQANPDDVYELDIWTCVSLLRSQDISRHADFEDIVRRTKDDLNDLIGRGPKADAVLAHAVAECQSGQARMKFEHSLARECMACGKEGASKFCSSCGSVPYCDASCQNKDLKSHKALCKRFQNIKLEIESLKTMDDVLRCPLVTLEDKKRAFVCWKKIRTTMEWEGRKRKNHNTSISCGKYIFTLTMNYVGKVRLKGISKTKHLSFVRLRPPWQEFNALGFNNLIPWESDVDAAR